MRAPRLLLLTLAIAAAALLAACGVEGGDDAASSTTTEAPATSEPDTSQPDADPEDPASIPPADDEFLQQLVDTYVSLGFTEEEARCVAEGVFADDGGLAEDPTVGGMDIINDCGISASRLMELGESMGGGSMDETIRRSLIAGFTAAGIAEADAECVADEYLEAYGADPTASQDPANLAPLFEACGLEP